MWLKFLLSVLIIAFCILLGYFAAEKWRSRKKFYLQYCLFHERYLNELTYARKPLPSFLKEYSYSGDFAKILKTFSERQEWGKYPSFLTKEEQDFCKNYFSMLGKGDAVSQKNFFSAQSATLSDKRSLSEKEAKSRGELYLKLGLLAGFAIVILII